MKKTTLTLFLAIACHLVSFAQANEQEELVQLQDLTSEGLSLRTNLIHWGVLTPSLGAEYRLNENWGLIVDGAYARWDWKSKSRRHRVWQVKPQARRYFSTGKDTYLGVEYTAGQYSFNWSGSGKEADFMGGGIAFGHQFYVGRKVMIDVGASLGYLRLSDRLEYERIGNKDLKTKDLKDKNYWGPTNLSMTLVWKLF